MLVGVPVHDVAQRWHEESLRMWLTATESEQADPAAGGGSGGGAAASEHAVEGMSRMGAAAAPRAVAAPARSLRGLHVAAAAAGYGFTAAVTTDGRLFMCGYNDRGQLGCDGGSGGGGGAAAAVSEHASACAEAIGRVVRDFKTSSPRQPPLRACNQLSFPARAGLAGLGHRMNMPSFQMVKALEPHRVMQVACGQQHVIARVAEGARHAAAAAAGDSQHRSAPAATALYGWGNGNLGQLGIGIYGIGRSRLRPCKIELVADDDADDAREAPVIVDIACGTNHNVAVTADGAVYGWGHSEYNQHGNDDDTYRGSRACAAAARDPFYYYRPRRVPGLGGVRIAAIACGANFTLGITTDRTLYSWGWNGHYVLGGGPSRVSPSPARVLGLTGVRHVSAGMRHAVAIADPLDGAPLGRGALAPLVNNAQLADARLAIVVGGGDDNDDCGDGGDGDVVFVHRCRTLCRASSVFVYLFVFRERSSTRLSSQARASRSCAGLPGLPTAELHADEHPDLNAAVLLALVTYLYTDRLKCADDDDLTALGRLAQALRLPRLAALCAKRQTWRARRDWFDARANPGADVTVRAPRFCGCQTWRARRNWFDARANPGADVTVPESTLHADLEGLVDSWKHADLCLKLEGPDGAVTFPAHKPLLCRFEYFRALLCGAFAESRAAAAAAPRAAAAPAAPAAAAALPLIDLSGFVEDGLCDARLFAVLLRHACSGAPRVPPALARDGAALAAVVTAAAAAGMEDLVAACERALVAHAAAAGSGSPGGTGSGAAVDVAELHEFAEAYGLRRLARQCTAMAMYSNSGGGCTCSAATFGPVATPLC
ncbi:regulator of chromosome condensation 1/beta-lactamase-inhibitor protein II [Tribonema minus]|uniref:Regulator of chromosome condensation 1/beta-lactamase-inhibitor protein II n=1 Tax=Tribonema minus TaxID=303371 RepID=A0A835ZLU7_9STRA|nr:regulator of chromosome condensation 1/beta-lactamase-inhibitor protein II [Tribonema minus]